ncbi:MAG: nuclear transport factor 2 family protein [Propionibacteriales bacterium]|nr:nuclear transport factor 2 family protein [Propionibacteriales bacterium]
MEQALRDLLDKQEITELLMRYCRGVDRCDEALVRSVYHADAFDNHGYWKGSGHEFAAFITERLRAVNSASLHSLANVLIELDGDEAHCESHVYASMVRREGEPQMIDFFAGRYVDQVERRDGRWGISHRVVVMDWVRSDTGGPGPGWPVALDDYAQGARFPDDPIYL